MEYWLTAILTLIDGLAFVNICKAFLKPKKDTNLNLYTIIFLSVSILNQVISTSEFYNAPVILIMLLFFAYTFFTFKGSIGIKLIIIISDQLLMYAADYFAIYTVMKYTGMNTHELIMSKVYFMIIAAISKLTLITISVIVRKYMISRRKNINISVMEWLLFVIYVITSFIVIYLFMGIAIEINYESPLAILVTAMVVVSNVFIFFILFRLDEINDTKQRNALLSQQVKIEMESVDALTQAYSAQRSLSHDFNNHISTIKSLLDSENTEKAKEYVNSLTGKSLGKTILFNSNNSVVDALLTQKYNVAKQHYINMQVKIDDLSNLPMKDEDIVVVLSNLLDNAIEAAKQCVSEKSIKLKFVSDNDGYILSVHNTTNRNISFDGQNIVSSKEDKLNHGYGIKNIKTILERYGYEHTITNKDGKVAFTVLMQR